MTVQSKIVLHAPSNSGGKRFVIIKRPTEDGSFHVSTEHGAMSGSMRPIPRTANPVPEPEADKIIAALVKKKTTPSAGYTVVPDDEANSLLSGAVTTSNNPSEPFPCPLYPVDDPIPYIDDDSYIQMQKMDGERRVVESTMTALICSGRYGQTKQIPMVLHDHISRLTAIFDTEIIG